MAGIVDIIVQRQRVANTEIKELACKCERCGGKLFLGDREEEIMGNLNKLIERIALMEKQLGSKIRITSGFRCERRNREVGGLPDSSHLIGLAVDISTNSNHERFMQLRSAIMAGFRRIGIGGKYMHLDIDDSKPKDVCWIYTK